MTVQASVQAPHSDGKTSPYYIDLLTDGDTIRRDGVIEGIVGNTGATPWREQHLVGLRHFRDVYGTPIPDFELRATMGRRMTSPGEQAHFRFDLARAHLPAGAASCVMDVVEEHVAWLSEIGGTPIKLRIAGASRLNEWVVALRRLGRTLPSPAARKIDLLAKMLRNTDLGAQANVKVVRGILNAEDANKPRRLLKPHSALVAAALPRRPDGGDPRELFLRHFSALLGKRIDAADPEDGARLLPWMIREAPSPFHGMAVPLPRALCAWLGRRALPAAIATTTATRSMVATLEPGDRLEINPADGGAELAWRFVTSVLIDHNASETLLPDATLAVLTRPARPVGIADDLPPPTRFMERLHADDAHYRCIYDLDEEWSRLAFAIDLYMLGLENETRRALLGAELRDWLTSTLSEDVAASIIEIALLAITDREIPPFDGGELGADIPRLRRAIPWLAPFAPAPAAPTLRLIGEAQSPSGLGVNLRMSKAALDSLGVQVEVLDTQQDLKHPAGLSADGFVLARPVDLFHLNLDALPALVCRYAEPHRRDSYRIGFALWETSTMPEQHRAGMELADEIWAPTNYVADLYRAAGHPNVHVVGKGISLPPPAPFDLRSLDIPDGVTTFLLSFDMDSWVDRKNPAAAVRAFRHAFPDDADVRLIVKSNGLHRHPGDRSNQAGRLEAAAEADPRILLLSGFMPWTRYLGLIAAVDATISPHRSEGFGYLSAYSLLLGTPTIVTDHSGTRDFCDQQTSFPVPAKLVPVRPGDFVFDAADAVWAEIDGPALAAAMRKVRDDPAEAHARAARGRALVTERYSLEALARRYAERLAALA